MDSVSALLDEARAAGLRLEAVGDQLIVRGPRAAAPLVARLRRHRDSLLALLARQPGPAADPEVAARVAAFHSQLARWTHARRSGVPLLGLPGVEVQAGRCLSCGEPLAPGRTYRCVPCVAAVEALLGLPPVLE